MNFQDDEDAFEVFSMYCGLGLHHAKLYDKIRRSEQKCKGREHSHATIPMTLFELSSKRLEKCGRHI